MTERNKKSLSVLKLIGVATVLSSAAVGASTAAAQTASFPSKPVTIVTPFAAGSGPDAVLRLVAEKLYPIWNQRVLIDNKPGAAGFIAIDIAKRAAPDGYTLLQLDSEQVSALPLLYKQKNFRTFDSFEPAASMFRTPFLIATSVNSKLGKVSDLVNAAKSEPNGMTYGSWGVGSPAHLGASMLETATGTQMRHVPYREVSQLFTAVATGDIAWSFATLPSSQGMYRGSKIKYLAVAAMKRIPQLPDIPTVAESGGPTGFELNSFAVLLAPKGTSSAITAKINADLSKAMADPEIRARFDSFAFEPLNWSSDEIRAQSKLKSIAYEKVIQQGNISLD